MRQTVVIDPQRYDPLMPKLITFRGPDSLAVASIGRDRWVGESPYDDASKNVHEPFASNDESIVRGDTLFHAICWTCHGKTMAGDGPVAAQFMTPPDLLAEATRKPRGRFIYNYMRLRRRGDAVLRQRPVVA